MTHNVHPQAFVNIAVATCNSLAKRPGARFDARLADDTIRVRTLDLETGEPVLSLDIARIDEGGLEILADEFPWDRFVEIAALAGISLTSS